MSLFRDLLRSCCQNLERFFIVSHRCYPHRYAVGADTLKYGGRLLIHRCQADILATPYKHREGGVSLGSIYQPANAVLSDLNVVQA